MHSLKNLQFYDIGLQRLKDQKIRVWCEKDKKNGNFGFGKEICKLWKLDLNSWFLLTDPDQN